MDVTTITIADFQAQFFRDFSYLPVYDAATAYNVGNTVYYSGMFYTALIASTAVTPGTDPATWQQISLVANDYVQPQDITNAFLEAQVIFNPTLFTVDAQVKMAYLYLTAHYLVNDLRTATQGIESTGNFPVASRSVGSISESYAIPDSYKNNAQLAFFTTSGYGMKYLSLVLPNLVGNFGSVYGGTSP